MADDVFEGDHRPPDHEVDETSDQCSSRVHPQGVTWLNLGAKVLGNQEPYVDGDGPA